MPIAKTDGAAQEFAIYEDSDAMEARDMDLEDRRRTENVYTPSEFEQENYVDSPDTPDLPPNVWARQAALVKAHYTTPQSPTAGSPYYTTTQSPTIRSPPPSPMDLSHLSASDYPEPLRLAPSPVRPPGPKSRRVVRDNPFVVADQLSARHGRVMRVDSDAGIKSRDGQASPQPGRYSSRDWARMGREGERASPQPGRYSARAIAAARREKRREELREEDRAADRRMWQTNRVPLPGFGDERERALRPSRGEKIPAVERAPRPKKLDPVMSETLTPSGSKAGGGNVVDEGGYDAHPVPDGGKNGDEKRDGSESSTSGEHGDCKACPCSKAVQSSQGSCPLCSPCFHPPYYCGCYLQTQVWNCQTSCQLQTGYAAAPFYPSYGYNPPVHPYPIAGSGCCGHVRNEQAQTVLWVQVPSYEAPGGSGCCSGGHGSGGGRNGGCQVVSTGNSCQCHCGKGSRRGSAQGGKGDPAIGGRL
ncbi:hypothetical protein V501_10222 [Pseudogymnoascus sp. VKM F-4519 (FW-2642)]|nr:hypothetical protein V501_10222 [Pseudogymnoascus sp. VKM F-4519 (FW-2642)]